MLANEIIPGLWVGQKEAAPHFTGEIICVLEAPYHRADEPRFRVQRGQAWRWLPIIDNGFASTKVLDQVAFTINGLLNNRKRVLVHCGAGRERSPLAVAWFLTRYRGMTLDDAYELLKRKRPEVEDRRAWIKEEAVSR